MFLYNLKQSLVIIMFYSGKEHHQAHHVVTVAGNVMKALFETTLL
jgi:hypothetical protein